MRLSLMTCALLLLGGASTAAAQSTSPVKVDPDLGARFALAAVPGIEITLARGAPLRAARPQVPDCDAQPVPICAGPLAWKSAPETWTPLGLAPAERAGAHVLLATERGDPLLLIRGKTVLLAAEPNGTLRRWPYFNYLLYSAASMAAGASPDSFATWKNSPMPQARTRSAVGISLLGLWAAAIALYRFARRRGRQRPDAAADFFAAVAAQGSPADAHAHKGWNSAGFTRPLAGLFTVLAAMLILIGPYFLMHMVIGKWAQPFPEADGMWRPTFDTLWVAWALFDMGTQTTFVKYFAETRTTRPAEALANVQFYVWWQVFARLVEACILCGLALGYLSYTRYALFAPMVLIYSSLYMPSVGGLGKLTCQAIQRFDYQNLLDMAEFRLLFFVIPVPFVLVGRAWGAANPIYGEAFGAAIGLGSGLLANNLFVMALGFGVLRHLKIPLRPLLLAQFDRKIAFRQLWLGFKVTLAQEPFRLTTAIEQFIITTYLLDFTTWLGFHDILMNRLVFVFWFSWTYYENLMPAISEALGAAKLKLAQYYTARYMQFGLLFTAALFSFLVALGPAFIRGTLGSQWGRAADYLFLAAGIGIFLPGAWISDSVQRGAGKGGLYIVTLLIEQGLRIGLMFVLVPRMQFAGLFVAGIVAIAVKLAFGFTVNHFFIAPVRFPPWIVFGAPAVACLANYALWHAVGLFFPPAHSVAAFLALFFFAGAASFFVCFFVCGLVGGFDPAALTEIKEAARLPVVIVRPMSRALGAVAHLGARLAPLKAGPLEMAKEAWAEAAEIDAMAEAATERARAHAAS